MNKTDHFGYLPVLLIRDSFLRDILRTSPCITKNTVTSLAEAQNIKPGSKKVFIFNRQFIHSV